MIGLKVVKICKLELKRDGEQGDANFRVQQTGPVSEVDRPRAGVLDCQSGIYSGEVVYLCRIPFELECMGMKNGKFQNYQNISTQRDSELLWKKRPDYTISI